MTKGCWGVRVDGYGGLYKCVFVWRDVCGGGGELSVCVC